MNKEVDAMDNEKTILKEKKFFEMECQLLDFGGTADKPEYALHF
jgi:hypothetical protein